MRNARIPFGIVAGVILFAFAGAVLGGTGSGGGGGDISWGPNASCPAAGTPTSLNGPASHGTLLMFPATISCPDGYPAIHSALYLEKSNKEIARFDSDDCVDFTLDTVTAEDVMLTHFDANMFGVITIGTPSCWEFVYAGLTRFGGQQGITALMFDVNVKLLQPKSNQ